MSEEYIATTPRDIKLLGHELSGVIADVEHSGFDSICLETITRVQTSLFAFAEEFRLIKASEFEGWRYPDELEQERKRLSALLDKNGIDKELT
jgi:hypothetical protein